jgi:hypothetical protein
MIHHHIVKCWWMRIRLSKMSFTGNSHQRMLWVVSRNRKQSKIARLVFERRSPQTTSLAMRIRLSRILSQVSRRWRCVNSNQSIKRSWCLYTRHGPWIQCHSSWQSFSQGNLGKTRCSFSENTRLSVTVNRPNLGWLHPCNAHHCSWDPGRTMCRDYYWRIDWKIPHCSVNADFKTRRSGVKPSQCHIWKQLTGKLSP